MPAPGWIEHVDFGGEFARTAKLDDDERFFMENRERATTIAESQDPAACYSYDDWALVQIDNEYFVFMTAGCSCPSPSETWSLMKRGNQETILDYLNSTNDTSDAFGEFLREIEKAGWMLRNPAPSKRKTDW